MLIASVGTVRLKLDSLWEERLQGQAYYSQMIPKWLLQVNYFKLLWYLLCSVRSSAKPHLNYRLEQHGSYRLYIELMTHHNA